MHSGEIVRLYRVRCFSAEFSHKRGQVPFFLFDDYCDQAVAFVGPAYPVTFPDAETLFYFLRDIEMVALADNGLQRFRHMYQLLFILYYVNVGASRPGGNPDPGPDFGCGLLARGNEKMGCFGGSLPGNNFLIFPLAMFFKGVFLASTPAHFRK